MNLISRFIAYMHARVIAFVADIRGVSTVEYALMVVAVIAAVAVAAGLLGGAFKDLFKDVSEEMVKGITKIVST